MLYLVHGAGDSDENWTKLGHAHYILDNLISQGRARPMIVVMPNGHTPGQSDQPVLNNRDFGRDLTEDLIPFVDANFRTRLGVANRAMAGLSMGGAHTMNFGLTRADLFRYVGIFSMGLGFQNGERDVQAFETANAAALRQAAGQMKLVYYAMGKDDFLYRTVAPTRQMFDRQGIRYIYHETNGGHTWDNWRRYLYDLAPRLFQ